MFRISAKSRQTFRQSQIGRQKKTRILAKLSESTVGSGQLIFKSPLIEFISFVERKSFIKDPEKNVRTLFENVIRDQYVNFN